MSSLRVTFAALVACASLTASAWWETTVTTNTAYTARSYIQDGLIAMWDGIENAGWGTHDASATTWKDLIGSVDVTCTGVTVNDMYLYFPKTGSQGTASFSSLTPYGCLEIALTKSQAGDHMNIISVGALYSGWGMCDSYGKITDTQDGKASPYVTMTYGIDLSPTTVSLNFTNNTSWCGEIAKNGVIGSEGTIAAGGRYNGGSDCINLNGDRSAEKRMYSIRMYSRNLTAAEIAANYAVDKQRFIDGWGNNPVITTNRVYHANPPQTAYDAASPWNAKERTRLGGDARTLRPSAQIVP